MAKLIVRKGETLKAQTPQPQVPVRRIKVAKDSMPAPASEQAPARRVIIGKGVPQTRQPEQTPARRVVVGKAVKHQALPVAAVGSDGRYRIGELVGEGGSGRVFRAHDQLLDMDVAIKFLSPTLLRDEAAINALKAETRICLGLVHSHIIRIYNLEKRGANYMLVMEFLKGATLQRYLEAYPGGLPADTAAQIVQIVAGALGYAHRHGVLHKDITPGNIFITDDDIVKVIDFGIASVAGERESHGEFVVGTPDYMSPEQLRGEALGPATDIYSLGVLAHQLLTGRTVQSQGATPSDMAYSPHPPLENVAGTVREVLEKATAFDPGERWESMQAFGAAFSAAVGELMAGSV